MNSGQQQQQQPDFGGMDDYYSNHSFLSPFIQPIDDYPLDYTTDYTSNEFPNGILSPSLTPSMTLHRLSINENFTPLSSPAINLNPHLNSRAFKRPRVQVVQNTTVPFFQITHSLNSLQSWVLCQ